MKVGRKTVEVEKGKYLDGDLQGDLADEIDDPEVLAALDKIFERIEQESAEGKGIPLRTYIEEAEARFRERRQKL